MAIGRWHVVKLLDNRAFVKALDSEPGDLEPALDPQPFALAVYLGARAQIEAQRRNASWDDGSPQISIRDLLDRDFLRLPIGIPSAESSQRPDKGLYAIFDLAGSFQ